MKRQGNLWSKIVTFENLYEAHCKARKGKRYRASVLAFSHNLEPEILQLQRDLQAQTYYPGAYQTFEIREPKVRLISAAPYRDRVVHLSHANTWQFRCHILNFLNDRGVDSQYCPKIEVG